MDIVTTARSLVAFLLYWAPLFNLALLTVMWVTVTVALWLRWRHPPQ